MRIKKKECWMYDLDSEKGRPFRVDNQINSIIDEEIAHRFSTHNRHNSELSAQE